MNIKKVLKYITNYNARTDEDWEFLDILTNSFKAASSTKNFINGDTLTLHNKKRLEKKWIFSLPRKNLVYILKRINKLTNIPIFFRVFRIVKENRKKALGNKKLLSKQINYVLI